MRHGLVVAGFQESYDPDVIDGVTHILNVAAECNVRERVGRVYAKIAIRDDDESENIARILPDCVLFITSAHEAGGIVLVHCLEGVSRSACVAIAYLCVRDGMSYDDALLQLRQVRPQVDPFPTYAEQTRVWLSNYKSV